MPARNNEHKIASGTRDVTYMDGTAVKIRDFPLQAAQGIVPWLSPEANFNTPTKEAFRYTDGTVRVHGFYRWQWEFSIWTFAMWSYFETQFLGGGDASADVTVLTYDDTNTAMYLTAKLINPKFNNGLATVPKGWRVTLEFIKGVEIT